METQSDFMQRVIDKAGEDAEFRTRLRDNPRLAIKETFDIQFPDSFNVVVHENDARTAHILLRASTELTDVQLQRAAGGGGVCLINDTLAVG